MSVATAYYRKADGVILVFDVTNEKSFVNIKSRWLDAIMSEDWFVVFAAHNTVYYMSCNTLYYILYTTCHVFYLTYYFPVLL